MSNFFVDHYLIKLIVLPELNPNIRSVYIVSSRKLGSQKSPECFFVTQRICSYTKRDEPDSKNVKGK
jgi:hypothetical protein